MDFSTASYYNVLYCSVLSRSELISFFTETGPRNDDHILIRPSETQAELATTNFTSVLLLFIRKESGRLMLRKRF